MAPTAEQRAVLDLVLERRLGYGAIATMTRMAPADVRDRARGAVTALGGADPGEDVTALLLGLADEDQARAARGTLAADPRAAALAVRVRDALQDGWPGYRVPELPRPVRRTTGVLGWAVAGALVVAAIAAVLVASGVLGTQDGTPSTSRRTAAEVPPPVRVTLTGVGGIAASGSATIGSTASLQPYMDLRLEDLRPPRRGSVHLLWADDGRGRGVPLPAPVEQEPDGSFDRRYDLSPALAPVLALSRRLELLEVDAGKLATLTRAVEGLDGAGGSSRFPRRPGTVLLAGAIPRS